MSTERRVQAALDTVLDPELDAPITELGFVTSCTVEGDGTAHVRLRLPTFYCAPNFAFLIVAHAYDAVAHVDGVKAADIVLEDHFAASEINAGVAARAGFAAAFQGLAVNELDDLRPNSCARRCSPRRTEWSDHCWPGELTPRASPTSPSGTCHPRPTSTGSAVGATPSASPRIRRPVAGPHGWTRRASQRRTRAPAAHAHHQGEHGGERRVLRQLLAERYTLTDPQRA
jgi:metal-sulfur cluster biosynthetic enzyme